MRGMAIPTRVRDLVDGHGGVQQEFAGGGETAATLVDEILVGTQWSDLTFVPPAAVIPEPGSAVLFGLSGLLVALRRRRRRGAA